MDDVEGQTRDPGAQNRIATKRDSSARGSTATRDAASWVNWQAALYLFVLGWICILLAPITSFWWLVVVCAMATPIALSTLNRPGPAPEGPDDGEVEERGLPKDLVYRGELTVDEASKIFEELTRKGHLGCDGAPPRTRAQRLEDPLSERELEVLALLASGRTNAEIARDLFVAIGTVKSHTGNIYRKLDARNRAEALARARELKVLR